MSIPDIPIQKNDRVLPLTTLVERTSRPKDAFGFFLVLVYFLLEYGRPMDQIGVLRAIRPAMLVSLLLMASWIVNGKLKTGLSPDHNKQIKMIWLFVILLAVYIPFAENNFRAYNQAFGVLLYMPFILSFIFYVNTFDRLRKFFTIWIILMIYISVRGILGGGIGGSSFMADENDFSLLMNMMLPFGFFLFMYERNLRRKMLYIAASVLAVGSVVVSASRGGFLGLIAVLGVFWLFSPRKMVSLSLVAVLCGALYYFSDQSYWAEMSTMIDTEDSTAKQRLDSWDAAWEMFKANPWGVGGGNFPVRFPDYQPDTMQRNMWGRAAHSLWFTLLSELGVAGMIIYGLLLRYNFRDLFWLLQLRKEKEAEYRYIYYLSLAFLASLVGYFVSGTFLSVLYYPHYFYMTAMIVGIKKLVEKKQSESIIRRLGA